MTMVVAINALKILLKKLITPHATVTLDLLRETGLDIAHVSLFS